MNHLCTLADACAAMADVVDILPEAHKLRPQFEGTLLKSLDEVAEYVARCKRAREGDRSSIYWLQDGQGKLLPDGLRALAQSMHAELFENDRDLTLKLHHKKFAEQFSE